MAYIESMRKLKSHLTTEVAIAFFQHPAIKPAREVATYTEKQVAGINSLFELEKLDHSYVVFVAPWYRHQIGGTCSVIETIYFGAMTHSHFQSAIKHVATKRFYGLVSQFPSIYDLVSYAGADQFASYTLLDNETMEPIYATYVPITMKIPTGIPMREEDMIFRSLAYTSLLYFDLRTDCYDLAPCRLLLGELRSSFDECVHDFFARDDAAHLKLSDLRFRALIALSRDVEKPMYLTN